jgi:hypothetical protein
MDERPIGRRRSGRSVPRLEKLRVMANSIMERRERRVKSGKRTQALPHKGLQGGAEAGSGSHKHTRERLGYMTDPL